MSKLHNIERDCYFGADLGLAAHYLLKESDSPYKYYFDLAGYVFLSFLIESYLNYVLFEVSKVYGWQNTWADLEKKLSAEQKYFLLRKEVISKQGNLDDWPSFASELFILRNKVAHMKPQFIKLQGVKESLDQINPFDPSISAWHENFIHSKWKSSYKFLEDVEHFLEGIKIACDSLGVALAGFNWPSGYNSVSKEV